mgnify:CR=1 FL=1
MIGAWPQRQVQRSVSCSQNGVGLRSAISENEQEREVLDGFVGSATAEGADGHAGSALLQTRFADDFSAICTTTTIRLTGWVCCDTGVQAPKENRSSLGLPKRVLDLKAQSQSRKQGEKLQRSKQHYYGRPREATI